MSPLYLDKRVDLSAAREQTSSFTKSKINYDHLEINRLHLRFIANACNCDRAHIWEHSRGICHDREGDDGNHFPGEGYFAHRREIGTRKMRAITIFPSRYRGIFQPISLATSSDRAFEIGTIVLPSLPLPIDERRDASFRNFGGNFVATGT